MLNIYRYITPIILVTTVKNICMYLSLSLSLSLSKYIYRVIYKLHFITEFVAIY